MIISLHAARSRPWDLAFVGGKREGTLGAPLASTEHLKRARAREDARSVALKLHYVQKLVHLAWAADWGDTFRRMISPVLNHKAICMVPKEFGEL